MNLTVLLFITAAVLIALLVEYRLNEDDTHN